MRQHESMRRRKAPPGLLGPATGAFAFVALAGAMVSGNGRYTPLAIVLVLAGFGSLSMLAWETLRSSRASTAAWEYTLAVSLVLCLILGLTTPPGSFIQGAAYRVVQSLVNLVLIGAVAGTFLRRAPVFSSCRVVFVAAVAAGFGLRLAMPVVSPAPVIDVFVQFQESAQHLLAGLNPYTVPFSDVYRGTRDYGYHTFGYAYLPANILPQTLAYWLTGDIRYGCIAAEAVVAGALYRIARPGPGRLAPMLVVLLFLYHPRGLYVIEQAWTEPFIAGAFALFLWLRDRAPGSSWPAAAYGYMLSLKQYLVYFVVHLFMIERRPKALAAAAATGFLTLVPFLIWNPKSLYTYGFMFQLETPFRPDGLTVVALLYRLFGFTAGKWLAALVGLFVGGYTYWRFAGLGLTGYLLAVTLTTYAMFLFGSQAFCNYYYLVSVLCLFVLALHARPAASQPTGDAR